MESYAPQSSGGINDDQLVETVQLNSSTGARRHVEFYSCILTPAINSILCSPPSSDRTVSGHKASGGENRSFPCTQFHFISFHLFADNIAIYKADTVILGCRSPQGNNLLRGAYQKNKVKK